MEKSDRGVPDRNGEPRAERAHADRFRHPVPMPLNRQVSVTVSADMTSGTAVPGSVIVTGVTVGTGTPFRPYRVRAPGTHPPEWDIT